jgi:hypothetical protein
VDQQQALLVIRSELLHAIGQTTNKSFPATAVLYRAIEEVLVYFYQQTLPKVTIMPLVLLITANSWLFSLFPCLIFGFNIERSYKKAYFRRILKKITGFGKAD